MEPLQLLHVLVGLGVCLEALQVGQRLIAVSNPDRRDQHQQDLLTTLAADNYLIWCRDVDHLDQAIALGRQIALRPYQQPECTLHLCIREYLAGLDAARSEARGLGKPPLWRRIRLTRGDPR
jgi:hypothetical protein